MRYISEDGKIFNTEQECCEYEQRVKQEKENKEMWEEERKSKLNTINKKYSELQELISEFEEEYGVRQKPYFAPFYDLVNMLCI